MIDDEDDEDDEDDDDDDDDDDDEHDDDHDHDQDHDHYHYHYHYHDEIWIYLTPQSRGALLCTWELNQNKQCDSMCVDICGKLQVVCRVQHHEWLGPEFGNCRSME